MNEKEFISKMKKILDNENITIESALADIVEWDSLSAVSYIAMANAELGIKITPNMLIECITLKDLYNLLVKCN